MANAFEAILKEDKTQNTKDTSVSFDALQDFKNETSELAKERSKVIPTYEEIFNITKTLEKPKANFKTLDSSTKEKFRQSASLISEFYSDQISEIVSNEDLSDSEKRFRVQSSLKDMVGEISRESESILKASVITDDVQSRIVTEDESQSKLEKSSLLKSDDQVSTNINDAQEKIETALDKAGDNYTLENVENTTDEVTNNILTDLSHIAVTEVVGNVINSDTIAYSVNPILIAKDITESIYYDARSIVSSISEVPKTITDISDRVIDNVKGIASSVMKAPSDFVKGEVDNAKAWMKDKVDSFINGGTSTTGIEIDRVQVEKIRRSDYKVVFADASVGIINDSIYMSLDNFWDVDILVPFDNAMLGLPSFRECYGLDEYDNFHLPISSFSYIGEGIQNIEQELYPGLSIPIPMVFQKPSKFSIQLPELVHRKSGTIVSCMLDFKQKYLNYVMGNDKTSYTFRDFRSCAYSITLKKYSLRWELLKTWYFYAIPDVQISETGGSSAVVEFSELSFNVIGNSYNHKFIPDDEIGNLDDGTRFDAAIRSRASMSNQATNLASKLNQFDIGTSNLYNSTGEY